MQEADSWVFKIKSVICSLLSSVSSFSFDYLSVFIYRGINVNYQTKIITRGLMPIFFSSTLMISANAQSLDEILVTSSRISQPASEIATSISYLDNEDLGLRWLRILIRCFAYPNGCRSDQRWRCRESDNCTNTRRRGISNTRAG